MRMVSLFLLLLICTIGMSKASDIPPTARITLDNPARSELIGYTGETLTFSSATSTANCGSITLRLWKLDSGSWTSSMEEFTHTFTLPTGVYEQTHTLQLRVVNSCAGLDDIITKTITIRRDQRTYFVKDHLGSVRATVNEAGDVISYDDYYPFGLTMPGRSSNSANPNDNYKFTGYEKEDEAGLDLYHANARSYDPVLGRFMQIDPLHSERPGLSPFNYVQNNPLNRIDPTGLLDTWAFNSETGEVQWLNDAGGSETQYIHVTDGDGRFQKTVEVDGSNAYIGGTSDGWAISVENLWEGLTSGYNSNSGYEYSASDLRTRYALMSEGGPLSTEVSRQEAAGNAGPINAAEYVGQVGDLTGRLQNFSNFFGMIGEVSAPNMKIRRSIRGQTARSNILAGNLNARGASVSSVSAGGLRLQAAGSNLNTWQIYLKNTKGTYSGLGQGRNWVQSALRDYNRIMNQ